MMNSRNKRWERMVSRFAESKKLECSSSAMKEQKLPIRIAEK